MKTTFSTEDSRKDRLFIAWNNHLNGVHNYLGRIRFEEIYEGSATVLGFSEKTLGLELEDGRKIHDLSISREISENSRQKDLMFVILGFRAGKWWPLDLISIASILNEDNGKPEKEIHYSIDPRFSKAMANKTNHLLN
jgi:hypothetical protein